jgi:hypothetical protein
MEPTTLLRYPQGYYILSQEVRRFLEQDTTWQDDDDFVNEDQSGLTTGAVSLFLRFVELVHLRNSPGSTH